MKTATVRAASIVVGLVALAFLQSPGLLTADTKLDLVTNPGGLMAHGLLAWAPEGQFGQVQNQAYGYLWPMGPFFWLGQAIGLSAWVVQRAWWAVLLVVGFTGARRLLGRLGIGGGSSQLVGALAYVLAPRVIGLLGTTSVEAWPTMVLPWIVLPLVVRQAPWRAAALSGVAMLMLGGVNAVASLAVLVVPLLWLLLGDGLDRRLVRLGCWLAAAAAACAWWILPLVSLRSAAFPFLDYIESASVTSAVTSLVNVLRGAQHWVAYSGTVAGPSWTAGFELALRPGLILATACVAGAGVLGLGWRRPRIAQLRFLLACLAVGLLAMSTGFAGRMGSPIAGIVQHLLDHGLAPFRNVHKFDALVRLPVAAGLTHLIAIRRAVVATVAPRRVRSAAAAALVAGAVVVGLAATGPFLAGRAASRGAFDAVPEYWKEAATWLDENATDGRVMLLPASNFGEYSWGRPLDEPLTSLTRVSWVLRNAVPLGAPGAIRWMDGVDEVVRAGRGSDDLAPALAAAGVTHVVLRNDLSVDMPRTPPAAVRATIVGSPGFRRVAQFGPLATTFIDSQVVTGSDLPHEVEVYAVTSPPVAAVVDTDPLVVAGGPEAAIGHGLAAAGASAWIAAADANAASGGTGPAVDVATDTMAKRSQNFGAERGRDLTPTLDETADATRGRPAADVSPFVATTPRTTSQLTGAVLAISASSSGADPFQLGYVGPSARPYLAVDADPDTAWTSAAGDPTPTLELTLAEPADRLDVHLAGQSGGHRVTAVHVTSDAGEARVAVGQGDSVQLLLPRASRVWRIAIERIGIWPVGISDIDWLPGPTAEVRALPSGSAAGLVVARMDGGRRSCLDVGSDWACSEGWRLVGEEDAALVRSVPAPLPAGAPAVWVRPVPGSELSAVLDEAAGLRVTASSTAFDDPVARAGAMFDGDPRTGWIPAERDLVPQVEVRTDARTADRFGYRMDERYEGVTATLVADGRVVARSTPPGRTVSFAPVTAREWTIVFSVQASTPVPLRIREVDLGWPAVDRNVELGCGAGPALRLGAHQVPYRLSASVGELTRGALLRAEPCQGQLGETPADGPVRLESADLPWLRIDRVAWLADRPAPVAVPVTVVDAATRIVQVPSGPVGRVFALTEGFNAGWQAQLGGSPLEPVRLEGWRQGWRLPATTQPQVVTARFAPATAHLRGLAAGLVLAVAVAVMGLLAWRSRRPAELVQVQPRPLATSVCGALVVAVAFLLAGPVGSAVAGACLLLWPVGNRLVLVAPALLIAGAGVLQGGAWPGGRGLAQPLCVAGLALAAGALTHAVEEGPFDDLEGQPRDDSGDRDGEPQEEPEVASEERDAGRLGDQLEDEQVPQEHPVADAPGQSPGLASEDPSRV